MPRLHLLSTPRIRFYALRASHLGYGDLKNASTYSVVGEMQNLSLYSGAKLGELSQSSYAPRTDLSNSFSLSLSIRHQSFRRPFVSISDFLAGKISRKLSYSPSSSYRTLTVFFAFSLSALLHAFASFAMNRSGGGSLKFFLVQPFGILFESIVVRSLSKNGRDGILRSLVGYIWTVSWLLYWSPWFFDELVQVSSPSS